MLLTVILALPLVAWTDMLERRQVPRAVGALLGLLLFPSAVGGILPLIVPSFVDQGRELRDELPAIAEDVLDRVAGLLLIGVPYALALAMLAGLLEFSPYIGPIAAAIPTVLVAFLQSPGQGTATVALYVIVNQIEGNITLPLIMSKA